MIDTNVKAKTDSFAQLEEVTAEVLGAFRDKLLASNCAPGYQMEILAGRSNAMEAVYDMY